MKSFDKFLKEDADIERSSGVPSDFTRKSREQATRALGITPDDEMGQMPRIFPDFDSNMRQSNQLLRTDERGEDLTDSQLQDRITKLEQLAKKVVMQEFGSILKLSTKPIELDIKLVPPGGVISEIPDLRTVQQRPEMPQAQQRDERGDEDRDEERGVQQVQPDESGAISGQELVSAIDKKKILNMITQAAGKSTKDIIRYSELVETELQKIFGRTSNQILQCWVRMSDLADKMDWVIPINRKSQMMKNMPGGMAGACQVVWENYSGNFYQISLLLEKEAQKIVIKSVGIDFPMLIHETVKGVYLFLQSGAIKKDKESAKIIKRATSSFTDEAQDFRHGPPALEMLLKFVNNFPESDRYSRLETRVFAILAYDNERAKLEAKDAEQKARQLRQKADSSKNEEDKFIAEDAEFASEYLHKKADITRTDKQFIEIMKSLFSCFDLQGTDFVLDNTKFRDSVARTEIEAIISYIVEDLEEREKEMKELEQYQKDLEEMEKNKQAERQEEESHLDRIIKQSLYGSGQDVEEEKPYDQMTVIEIQKEIEKAVEEENYELAQELKNKYLKGEAKKVWTHELKRIFESKYRTR